MKISEVLKTNPNIYSKKLFATLFPDFVKREKEIFGIIYCFTAPDGKRNIGYSTTWRKRFKNYRGYHCKSQHYFYNALKLHGFENFDIKILWECQNNEELYEMETKFIKLFKSKHDENGYNIESGGRRAKRSEETKKKIGETHKRVSYWIGRKMSVEHRKKLSDARKGENHHNFGKKFSKERCEQMRLIQKREKAANFDKTIRIFYNIDRNETYVGNQYDLRVRENLYSGIFNIISDKKKKSHGWKYLGEYLDEDDKNKKIKDFLESDAAYIKIYRFYNIKRREEIVISQLAFRKKYNVSGGQLSILINRVILKGKTTPRRTIKGWYFMGEVK
jgi:group I intron endonuclease